MIRLVTAALLFASFGAVAQTQVPNVFEMDSIGEGLMPTSTLLRPLCPLLTAQRVRSSNGMMRMMFGVCDRRSSWPCM